MTFKDLIKSAYWEFVESFIRDYYYKDDPDYCMGNYRKVFDELLLLEPVETKRRICLTNIPADKDMMIDEPCVDVSGKDGTLVKESSDFEHFKDISEEAANKEISYGLEFSTFETWLGMAIDKETFENFSDIEIVGHCLYEMTFCGYDQETIQGKHQELKDRVTEIEAMPPEELKKGSMTYEEFKEKLEKFKNGSYQELPL